MNRLMGVLMAAGLIGLLLVEYDMCTCVDEKDQCRHCQVLEALDYIGRLARAELGTNGLPAR